MLSPSTPAERLTTATFFTMTFTSFFRHYTIGSPPAQLSSPLFSENCPFNDLCGLEITERRGGHCTVACRTGENHLNPYGIVHGGLLFTMMDVAGGYAARTLDSGETIRCVTQNASTVFLHPGKPGTLTAEGDVIRRGGRIIVATVCVYDSEHSLLTKGEFTYYRL